MNNVVHHLIENDTLIMPFISWQLDKEDEDSDFEDEDDRDFYQLAHMPI